MAVASCESCGKSGEETEKTEKIEDTGLINQRVYRYCTVSGKTPASVHSSVARQRGLCFTVRSCTTVLLGSKPKLAGRSHDNHRITYFLTELCVSVNKNLPLTHIFFLFLYICKGFSFEVSCLTG